jgi:DNA-binding CsgD family transcriptional regulator
MAEPPETRAIATRAEIWPAHFNLAIDGYFKMNLTDLLSLIERLPQCESSQQVGIAFGDFVASYGFVAAACGESREIPEGRSWEFFFNTWPAEWLLEYQKNDYVRHDLVPAVARLSARPFTWLEALAGRTPTAKQREHYDWAVSLGIVDVFAVPIHYPGGDFGLCVSIAGRPVEDTSERQALQMASMFAHQRCRELGGRSGASSAPTLLTGRELECLRWVLNGKSDTDISKILGISHTTVHFHIERAKKKLGVRTRTQAAATVMTLGYL